MIPRDYITAWRAKVAWVEDSQVELDLIISRALVEIFRIANWPRRWRSEAGPRYTNCTSAPPRGIPRTLIWYRSKQAPSDLC